MHQAVPSPQQLAIEGSQRRLAELARTAQRFRIRKAAFLEPKPAAAEAAKVDDDARSVDDKMCQDGTYTCTIDVLSDSGASRFVYSEEALHNQGVPMNIAKRLQGKLSEKLDFHTGNGLCKEIDRGVIFTSPTFGSSEAFFLENGPIAAPQCLITERHARPYVHMTGELPYYVTDPSRIKIHCPLKYRL